MFSSFIPNDPQAMTSIEDLDPAERKRQREALRRRMQQPGTRHLEKYWVFNPFHTSLDSKLDLYSFWMPIREDMVRTRTIYIYIYI